MENSSNVSDLICPPQITAEDSMFYEKFSFWTEGVIGCMIYFPGKALLNYKMSQKQHTG